MKGRKEYILEKAFEVFMSKGYDSVSITVLQKELGMSRGAMYRYFKGKDELFIEVIDKYFIGMITRFMPDVSDDITLTELIAYLYRFQKRIFKYVDKNKIKGQFLNYTALAIQAAKYYPGFTEKVKAFKTTSFRLWKMAIKNSIIKGDIRNDVKIDILASMFSSGATNPETTSKEIGEEFGRTIDNWKSSADYLYDLIKV